METLERALPMETVLSEGESTEPDLNQLFIDARLGNEAAITELFTQSYNHAFMIARAKNSTDPEAVAQDVMLKLYKNGILNPDFEPTNIPGWLQRVTTNLVFSNHRRAKLVEIEFFGAVVDPNQTETGGISKAVQSAIDRTGDLMSVEAVEEYTYSADTVMSLLRDTGLNSDFAAAVALDIEGYTYKEIADLLGIGMGTVRSRIHRGKVALRDIVEEQRNAELALSETA